LAVRRVGWLLGRCGRVIRRRCLGLVAGALGRLGLGTFGLLVRDGGRIFSRLAEEGQLGAAEREHTGQ
jgi:hypothetical protein